MSKETDRLRELVNSISLETVEQKERWAVGVAMLNKAIELIENSDTLLASCKQELEDPPPEPAYCETCKGVGEYLTKNCPDCEGTGLVMI